MMRQLFLLLKIEFLRVVHTENIKYITSMIWQSELLFPSHINNWWIVQLRNVEIIIIEIMFIFFKVFELTELLLLWPRNIFFVSFQEKRTSNVFRQLQKMHPTFLSKRENCFLLFRHWKMLLLKDLFLLVQIYSNNRKYMTAPNWCNRFEPQLKQKIKGGSIVIF